jgi:hypothetical protein
VVPSGEKPISITSRKEEYKEKMGNKKVNT